MWSRINGVGAFKHRRKVSWPNRQFLSSQNMQKERLRNRANHLLFESLRCAHAQAKCSLVLCFIPLLGPCSIYSSPCQTNQRCQARHRSLKLHRIYFDERGEADQGNRSAPSSFSCNRLTQVRRTYPMFNAPSHHLALHMLPRLSKVARANLSSFVWQCGDCHARKRLSSLGWPHQTPAG